MSVPNGAKTAEKGPETQGMVTPCSIVIEPLAEMEPQPITEPQPKTEPEKTEPQEAEPQKAVPQEAETKSKTEPQSKTEDPSPMAVDAEEPPAEPEPQPQPKREAAVEPFSVATPKVDLNFSAELKKVINERNMFTGNTRRQLTRVLQAVQSEKEEDDRRSERRNLVAEIRASEEKYVAQLEAIAEYFVKPAQEKKLLRPNDFETLFGHVGTISGISRELLEELRREPCDVAGAFSKMAPFFKCYSAYALEFKKSLQILQNAHRDNPKFAKFQESQESRPEVQSKLSALLIAPIQRVPRYKLLLRSLLSLTSDGEEGYDSLLDSSNKVEQAASHINEVIKDQENMQRLLELQRCFQSGEPNVITPGRRLEKEGALMKISPKDGHSRKLHVVLMSDIVMFCKTQKTGDSLKCSRIFPLNKCKVEEMLDKGSFRITCQEEELVLYHEKLSEAVEWIRDVKEAIRRNLDDRKTLRKESSARRPVKRKDVNEYNEVGVSPGKKLKKRRSPYYEENLPPISRPTSVTRRRPIRPDTEFSANLSYQGDRFSSIFITLKPKEEDTANKSAMETNSASKDLFVFGRHNADRGFSFRMNQFLTGIGSSVKKLFGFK